MDEHKDRVSPVTVSRRDLLKLLGVGALGASVGGLAGCGAGQPTATPVQEQQTDSGAADGDAKSTVNLDFIVWSYSIDTVQNNIDRFEQIYDGVDVSLSDFSWNAYHETMANRFNSGTKTDVAYTGGNWLPEWAKAGWVVPLEDHFPEVMEYTDEIVDYALTDMTHDGKLYGLPYYADMNTFLYNERILNENGINKPPETWEEVREQAMTLKENGMDTPFALEFAQSLPTTLDNFSAMVFGRGGELFDKDFNVLFNDAESAAWQQLQWLADGRSDGFISILPHETDVIKAMNTGQHAFTVLFNYNLAALNDEASSELAGEYKLGMMPGETHETYGFCKFYVMSSMAAERGVTDACWKFIKYFGGKHEGEYKVAKRWAVEKGLGFGQLPLYEDPEVQESLSQWVTVDTLRTQSENARARNQSVWYGVWGEFMRIQLVRAVTGEVSVEEAMQASADKAEQLKQEFA